MTDPVFFRAAPPITIAEIVALTGARAPAEGDRSRLISGIAPLERAGPGDVTFYDNPRYAGILATTRAGACFCLAREVASVPLPTVALASDSPHRDFAIVGARLYPDAVRPGAASGERGISPAARIDANASIEPDVTIAAGATVGPGAEIGRGSLIGPGTIIGPGVRIGRDAAIAGSVTITNAFLGNRIILHPGVRIGQDGFGFVPGAGGHTKIVQIGRVIIQDDVEIGANTAIDRGSSRDTIVGEGTKIDNLVQIGHNVIIGRHCLIAGQVGISGSVTIGDFVMIGGHAGIRDNVTIGNGAQVAAMAGIHIDVPAGERWAGVPAQPMPVWLREIRALKRIGGSGHNPSRRARAFGKEGDPPDG
jgi:UDP-3-O-[3-hydroxymyristoyl] glucosamine N-acyltransferase